MRDGILVGLAAAAAFVGICGAISGVNNGNTNAALWAFGYALNAGVWIILVLSRPSQFSNKEKP
jgi:hypothetical protein